MDKYFEKQIQKDKNRRSFVYQKRKKRLFLTTNLIIVVMFVFLSFGIAIPKINGSTKKCKYKYKFYNYKKCPYDALPGSDFCIWHEPKDGKNFAGKEIEDIDLVEAYLVEANFKNATFKNGADLRSASLQGADLRSASLQGADLRSANLQGADLEGTNLQGADLRSANLQGAYLRSASLQGADLEDTNLQGANLEGTNLQGANLEDTNLQGEDLEGTNLQGANLEGTNLQGANLEGASLQGADLWNANLQEADLWNANLQGADLEGANLGDTELKNADLRAAYHLFTTDIKNTKELQYAKLGNKCMEEILADNLSKMSKWYMKGPTMPVRKILTPDLKKIGLSKEEIILITPEFLNSLCPTEMGANGGKFSHYELPVSVYSGDLYGTKLTLYDNARDIYINLKNYFKDAGFYIKSGEFFVSEYRVRGKIYKTLGDEYAYTLYLKIRQPFNKLIRRENSSEESYILRQNDSNIFVLSWQMFSNYFAFFINKLVFITSSYGESVWRVLFTALLIIFTYAGIYSLKGSVVEEDKKKPVHDFWINLYFSIVTFTTLGYGDLHPTSSTRDRMLAGSEAFLGAFTIAYFVVVVSRKIMR